MEELEKLAIVLAKELNIAFIKKQFSTERKYWEGRYKLAQELLTFINKENELKQQSNQSS